ADFRQRGRRQRDALLLPDARVSRHRARDGARRPSQPHRPRADRHPRERARRALVRCRRDAHEARGVRLLRVPRRVRGRAVRAPPDRPRHGAVPARGEPHGLHHGRDRRARLRAGRAARRDVRPRRGLVRAVRLPVPGDGCRAPPRPDDRPRRSRCGDVRRARLVPAQGRPPARRGRPEPRRRRATTRARPTGRPGGRRGRGRGDSRRDQSGVALVNRVRTWFSTLGGGAALYPLVVLFGLATVEQFDQRAFDVLLPNIRDAFGLNTQAILAVVGLTGAAALVIAVPIGFYADRWSRVRIATWGALAWGVFSVLTGFAPVLWVLGLARAGSGLGGATIVPTHNSLLSDYYDIPRVRTSTRHTAPRTRSVRASARSSPACSRTTSAGGRPSSSTACRRSCSSSSRCACASPCVVTSSAPRWA